MKPNLKKYNQYKNDIFNKLNFNFESGKKILDVGCGDGTDIEIFINEYGLNSFGIDIYQHQNIDKLGINFSQASILNIPFKNESFDYVFLHDVLHHIDEEEQGYKKHIRGLQELKRVCKKGGYIIILEANRYNPLSYPHMVLARGHNHFRQMYLKKILQDVFGKNINFRSFEAHLYPPKLLKLFKIFEFFMEHLKILAPFRDYNLAVIKNDR